MSVDVNRFVDNVVQQLVVVAVAGLGRRFCVGDLLSDILQFLLCFALAIAWRMVWLSMTDFCNAACASFRWTCRRVAFRFD